MDFQNLFDKFEMDGKLLLPGITKEFACVAWSRNPANEGVELKHILTSEQTNGMFSFHLVKIAPGRKIGSHIHKEQLETHEVISGNGSCISNGIKLDYEPGVISIFPMGQTHEVVAGAEGLYLFAKFIPALC